MQVEQTPLKGLLVITPTLHRDERGFFMEVWRRDVEGLDFEFVQDNQSRSRRGVVRGLHFQWEPPLGKLIRVPRGRAFVVAADIRKSSATLGEWFGLELNEENQRQLWVPPGFASGFAALEDVNDVQYKYTALYNPQGESNILFNDADLAIRWPVAEPILSERDAKAETFKEWLARKESDLW